MPRLAALVAALGLASGAAQAAAWPQEEGRWLIVNQFTYSDSATNGYDSQGRPSGHGSLKQFQFSPYIEYGVTPELTVGMQPQFQVANLSGSKRSGGGTSGGLTQVNLITRYTIYRWDYDVLAVQAQLGIPGYTGNDKPAVADPWTEYEARLLYGHSFDVTDDVSGFFDTELAYRLNGGHASDQIHSDTTLGFKFGDDWLVYVQAALTFGLRNNVGTGGDYDQYRGQITLARRISDEVWLAIGGYHDFGGRNVALGNGVTASIWLRF